MGSQKNLVAQARFHVKLVDGEPKVEWEPKVNRWTGAEIQAVLKGAERLDGEWKAVEGAKTADYDILILLLHKQGDLYND